MEKPTEKGLDIMLSSIEDYLRVNPSMIPQIFETICNLHDQQEELESCLELK